MRQSSARLITVGLAILLAVNFTPPAWAAAGDPVAVNARTGVGFATIQAALDAAAVGDTITVLMAPDAPPAPYVEALTIAQDGVTLCATVALGTCAPISAPGRWQASASTIAAPPVPFQNDAVRAPSPGSTSFFANSQDPLADKLQVSEIDALSFAFLLETGTCTSGGVRFQLRLDTTGDSTPEKTIFAYPAPGFCTLGTWRTVDILNGGTWGLNQVGGASSGATKAQADALTATMNVTTINLIYDGAAAGSVAWFDNQRINDAVFREQVDTACVDANSPTCATVTARPATILDSPAGSASTVVISGDDVTLQGFTIRATGAGNVQNVLVTGSGASIVDNVIEGNPLTDIQFGVFVDAAGAAWEIANNTITRAGHTGIYVSDVAPGKIADNLVNQNRDNAIYVEGSMGLLAIERNELTQAVQANLRVTGTRPLVLRDNQLGFSEFTMDLNADLATVDARYNDWGAYSREDIEATINDDATGRVFDLSCYYGVDGVAVCPPGAAFTFAPESPRFNTAIQFTDLTTVGGNDIAAYSWNFGDSATSSVASPVHTYGASGVYTVTLTVTDSEGFTSVATDEIGIANAAPVLAAISKKTGNEGSLLTFALSASDADGDALTYSGIGLPAGASVNPTTGAFSWTPTFAQAGNYSFTLRVTDGELAATQPANVSIVNVDRAPVLAPVTNKVVMEGTALSVPLSATDADGDAIVLNATGLPAWATLASTGGTGTISGTPTSAHRGVSTITVTAKSGALTASQSFTITVQQAVALTFVPVGATIFHTSPGQVVTLNATITNGGSASDTFTLALTNTRGWTSSAPTNVTLAPGESATISATVTAPAKNERTSISWKATSQTSATVSATAGFVADTPIVLSIVFDGPATLLGGARATVTATWLDGSAAVNQPVTATQTPDLARSLTETDKGFTGADGKFELVFNEVGAGLPGSHTVIVVLNTPLLPTLTTSYSVGGLP